MEANSLVTPRRRGWGSTAVPLWLTLAAISMIALNPGIAAWAQENGMVGEIEGISKFRLENAGYLETRKRRRSNDGSLATTLRNMLKTGREANFLAAQDAAIESLSKSQDPIAVT